MERGWGELHCCLPNVHAGCQWWGWDLGPQLFAELSELWKCWSSLPAFWCIKWECSCFLRKRWKRFEHHAVLMVISLLKMWLFGIKKKKTNKCSYCSSVWVERSRIFFPSCLLCFHPMDQKTEAKWCCKIMFKESEQCLLFRRHRPQILEACGVSPKVFSVWKRWRAKEHEH